MKVFLFISIRASFFFAPVPHNFVEEAGVIEHADTTTTTRMAKPNQAAKA
ncbi:MULTISPECIES: hypothetical protein [Paenibacillus]|uniref:Uncharacterized protein n=1 Tax=Paenibacillus barengoltzii G22 TaxID=1235795 RepID=R9LIT8_9BACL|nr:MULTISPECIES: hypothetical protein [Paenibacillus]EOS58694.1 hypothetical protein C812_00298 [Paenibacillus barengoltzii G22]MDU0329340.1 hypothetical protein [Paenibacillus sp. 3LSP]MEC2344535.1 hypothetical protein [Paenibacillus barengoltzii]